MIQQIVAGANRLVNEASPIVDAKACRRVSCKCSAGADRIKWSNRHDSEISNRIHYYEAIDRMEFHQ